jgi:predicted hydrocarbon binding protein
VTRLAARLAFDAARGEIRDQSRRYLLLRSDVLMGMLRRLPPAVRHSALDAFAASVADHGRDSVLAYLARLEGDRTRLLEAMQDAAADLGWGQWRFEPAAAALRLVVGNSPFAAGFGPSGHPVCAPIAGMLQAVGRVCFDADVTSVELACAACGAPACVFEATVRAGGQPT